MSLEKPKSETAENSEKEYVEVEDLSRKELDELEGEEKEFAEFIEKRNKLWATMPDVRELDISEEDKTNIREFTSYLFRFAYKGFEDKISSDRRARIENGIIEKLGHGIKIVRTTD